jgi:hypothetical protein
LHTTVPTNLTLFYTWFALGIISATRRIQARDAFCFRERLKARFAFADNTGRLSQNKPTHTSRVLEKIDTARVTRTTVFLVGVKATRHEIFVFFSIAVVVLIITNFGARLRGVAGTQAFRRAETRAFTGAKATIREGPIKRCHLFTGTDSSVGYTLLEKFPRFGINACIARVIIGTWKLLSTINPAKRPFSVTVKDTACFRVSPTLSTIVMAHTGPTQISRATKAHIGRVLTRQLQERAGPSIRAIIHAGLTTHQAITGGNTETAVTFRI